MKKLLDLYNDYLQLSESDSFDFEKFNQYAIVHHSNSIEGSTLTLQETILLLDKKLTPNNKPLEHTLMAVDHLQALKYILFQAEKKQHLSVAIIQELSALIMKSTGSEISAIAERTAQLMNYINTSIDTVSDFVQVNELAFDAHFQMVSIHPFADGNGRLSRLLMNYIQHYHGLPLSVVYEENKQDYYTALEKTRETEDLTIFRNFMFAQTQKFITNRINELTTPQKESKKNGFNFLF